MRRGFGEETDTVPERDDEASSVSQLRLEAHASDDITIIAEGGAERSLGFRSKHLRWLVSAVVAGSLGLFLVIYFQNVTSVGSLTRDPTVTAGEPWYLGAASSLGAIGWAVAAGCFGFSAILVRRLGGTGWVSLAGATLFTLLLLIDDVFLLHDDIFLRLVGSELPIYGAYLALGALWFVLSVRRLTRNTLALLLTAALLLGLSIVVDQTWQTDSDLRLATEDGLKFAGIWLWALFALVLGIEAAERSMASRCD